MSRVGQILIVEWDDAWIDESETRAHDWKDAWATMTYGLCVRDTPKLISIAQDKQPDDVYKGVTHIPRAIVRKIRRLKEQ